MVETRRQRRTVIQKLADEQYPAKALEYVPRTLLQHFATLLWRHGLLFTIVPVVEREVARGAAACGRSRGPNMRERG